MSTEFDPKRSARVDLKLRRQKQAAKFDKRDLMELDGMDDRADEMNVRRKRNKNREQNS